MPPHKRLVLSPWPLRADPFEDILQRRVAAYVIDLVIVAAISFALSIPLSILTILSFGLLGFLWHLLPLTAVLYTVLMIAGPGSATLGMWLMSLTVRRTDGGLPSLINALLFALLFYLTVAGTALLVILLPLVTPRHRALHDYLSGTVVVRTDRAAIF